jgi:DNA-binding NtrC family response regulator
MSFDTTIWIVHRDPGPRGALARLAGGMAGRHEIVLGRPNDPIFASVARPDVVVLDVSASAGDPEPELELARRTQERAPDCAWILVSEPAGIETTRRLFDALDAHILPGPPDARSLHAALAEVLDRARPLPLSRRIGRDHVSARFVRWFSQGEPRELAVALDPRLAVEPVLARGERGTGRGLLLRYVHAISTADAGPFVRVACTAATRPDGLLAQIDDGVREAGNGGGRFGIWLEEIDRLDAAVQGRVLDWIEFGLPVVLPLPVRGGVRWFASAGPDAAQLDPRLAHVFVELTIRTIPLRDRPDSIEAFVSDTARAWASSRGEPAKSFDPPALDLLRGEPWPGNLAELEAVVIRTLAHASADAPTIRIVDLRFDPELETGGEGRRLSREAAGESVRRPPAEPDSAAGIADDSVPVGSGREDDGSIARLAAAVAHEVRNPLVSIRTFSELLPEHYADEEFRDRFGRLVANDVRRIEEVVERLEQLGESPAPGGAPIDMTALLEELLDEQRSRIQSKRLLVLKELDRARPEALGDEAALRGAISGLLAHAIEEAPERGDLYLASRHHAATPERATMRILLRHRVARDPATGSADPSHPSLRGTVLDYSVAESVIRRQGGTLSIDTTAASETVAVIDLRAPVARR